MIMKETGKFCIPPQETSIIYSGDVKATFIIDDIIFKYLTKKEYSDTNSNFRESLKITLKREYEVYVNKLNKYPEIELFYFDLRYLMGIEHRYQNFETDNFYTYPSPEKYENLVEICREKWVNSRIATLK